LYIDQELVEKSRGMGFNLSKTFENYLKQLITQFSQINSVNQAEIKGIHLVWCGRRDLDPNGFKSHGLLRKKPYFCIAESSNLSRATIKTTMVLSHFTREIAII
jgi:hypothetical protein